MRLRWRDRSDHGQAAKERDSEARPEIHTASEAEESTHTPLSGAPSVVRADEVASAVEPVEPGEPGEPVEPVEPVEPGEPVEKAGEAGEGTDVAEEAVGEPGVGTPAVVGAAGDAGNPSGGADWEAGQTRGESAAVTDGSPPRVDDPPGSDHGTDQTRDGATAATDGAAPEGCDVDGTSEEAGERAATAGDGTGPRTYPLPRVIAVANQKGGVGKTTTTVNLGAALAEIGYRVLVVDLDPQGNATTGLGIDARNFEISMYDVVMRGAAIEDCIEPTSVKNLFVAPATIDLAGVEIELVSAFSRELKVRKAIDTVVEEFDFILIDCPPSLGLITVNGLAAAREVLVPIQCEYYALEGLSQLLRNVHLVASNLNENLEVSTIVLTMYDARTRLAIDVASDVREHFADKVCRSVIPRTVRLSEAPSFGQPITVFDPTSRGAVAYRELAKEVSNGAPQRAG
jgi:chromosome partitioning protein